MLSQHIPLVAIASLRTSTLVLSPVPLNLKSFVLASLPSTAWLKRREFHLSTKSQKSVVKCSTDFFLGSEISRNPEFFRICQPEFFSSMRPITTILFRSRREPINFGATIFLGSDVEHDSRNRFFCEKNFGQLFGKSRTF